MDEFTNHSKSYNEDTGFDKEKVDINVAYEIFKSRSKEEVIDPDLATEFINELRIMGL